MSSRIVVRAFTDGSCKGNPGIGGWGWVAYVNQKYYSELRWSGWGGKKKTTNQQMELQAMAEFLSFCPRGAKVEVWSDSCYVLNGITGVQKESGSNMSKLVRVGEKPQGWINGWSYPKTKFGDEYSSEYWKKSDLKNPKEWYQIHQLILEHGLSRTELYFGWVKGHAGNEGNEIADKLANKYPLRNNKD